MIASLKHSSRPNPHSLSNYTIRPDVRRCIHLRTGSHDGRGMNPRRKGWLGKKERQNLRKSDSRVNHANDGLQLGTEVTGKENGRGSAVSCARGVSTILRECEIT